MYPSVQSYFRAFNEPFEGAIPYMYLDVKGLVTVGVGNLIDPLDAATVLPFRFKHKPELPASKDQIAAEWHRLKCDPSLAMKGHLACERLTLLELSNDAIDTLIEQRLSSNEALLKHQEPFHDFDTWPADAQLALLSMAWAVGPSGLKSFPKFSAACQRHDFETAALESRLRETGNPGVIPRNRANFALLTNASVALNSHFESAQLHYPASLAS
jgi:hypothetical protein